MAAATVGVLVDGKAVCNKCFSALPNRDALWSEHRVLVLSGLQGWSPRRRRECACGAKFLGRAI